MTQQTPAVVVTMVLTAALAWGARPVPARAQVAREAVVIRDATILTASHGRIERGSMLIQDGTIAAVGQAVDAPANATVIDGSGMFVTPGIIDCHSHMAIDGGVNEGTISVSSMVGTEDVLDPTDIDLYRAVAGGVTTANILHGSANAIGGRNAVIKLRWGKDSQQLRFKGAPPGIKFALGENPKRSNFPPRPGTKRRYPATRMGVIDVVREAFTEAVAYQEKWRRYEAGEKGAVAPARDLKLEALVEVLEGKRLVHAHSYRADEILQLLRLADEMGFKIATLQHVLEGYKVADEIAAHGAGASTFSDWWAYKIEAFDATPYNAALMTDRGVVVSINSDSAEEVRHLNQEAAKAMKYGGLSEEAALRLVTLNPAQQLQIDERVGSIDVGKDADLVLWKNHPLSVYAVAQKVFIDGQVYFDRERDLAQRTAREKEKNELLAKLKARRKPEDKPSSTDQESGIGNQESGTGLAGRSSFADGDRPASAKGYGGQPSPAFMSEGWNRESGVGNQESGIRNRESGVGNRESGNGNQESGTADQESGRPETSRESKATTYAIRGGRIVTLAGAPIARGTVVITDGRITAVGADVPIPPGAEVIEADGLQVYPGLFEAVSQLGLTEIGRVTATNDVTELGDFNPQLVAAQAVHPASEHIPVARANGLTHALSVPGIGEADDEDETPLIPGQASAIHLAGWTIDEMLLRRSVALVINWPTYRTRPSGFGARSRERRSFAEAEKEHDSKVRQLEQWLDEARHYGKAVASAESRVTRDLKLEALVAVTRGELPVLVYADAVREIKEAVDFCEQQKLRMILAGGAESYKLADVLAEKKIPVVLGPIQELPASEDEPYDIRHTTPATLHNAGVRFALGTFSSSDARNLPYEIGNAVSYGLPREAALAAITKAPAEIFGLDAEVGTIEVGKRGQLIVTDGDPLEIRTAVKYLFVNGRLTSLENRHLRLYEQYRARPKPAPSERTRGSSSTKQEAGSAKPKNP